MNSALLPQVMVATARQRGLNDVLRTMMDGIAQCANVVLARIWLISPTELCKICATRDKSDHVSSLHLVASAGTSLDPHVNYGRLDGAFHRFAIGERKIGNVAKTGEPLLLRAVQVDNEWLADHTWAEREGIKTVAAQPLVFHGETLGVLALFDRGVLDGDSLQWLRVFADYAAVSIANARALEEIEVLRAKVEEENLYLREEVSAALKMGDFIGESLGLQKVMSQIKLVAPTDAAVLITGESGTGKELVARSIHDSSLRSGRAFIKVNCSALPENLFESEFFGHVKGAFTGAIKDKPGRFEVADGGTLFLDEIGELPVAMQSKLLRVLQEREFERVGDTRTRKVDVRIIAATNRELKTEVESGRFRQDLFYRLSVFPIEVSPLRVRREDIPPLVAHFVKQIVVRLNRPSPRVTKATMSQLVAYDWPGNVRELQNAVERAVILSQGGALHFDLATSTSAESARVRSDPAEVSLLLTRDELKRHELESIVAALKQTGGKVFGSDGAAELLGMKPTTLSSRIKALGITRKPRD